MTPPRWLAIVFLGAVALGVAVGVWLFGALT